MSVVHKEVRPEMLGDGYRALCGAVREVAGEDGLVLTTDSARVSCSDCLRLLCPHCEPVLGEP